MPSNRGKYSCSGTSILACLRVLGRESFSIPGGQADDEGSDTDKDMPDLELPEDLPEDLDTDDEDMALEEESAAAA